MEIFSTIVWFLFGALTGFVFSYIKRKLKEISDEKRIDSANQEMRDYIRSIQGTEVDLHDVAEKFKNNKK